MRIICLDLDYSGGNFHGGGTGFFFREVEAVVVVGSV